VFWAAQASVVHFALKFVSVLFLKAIVLRSQRNFSLSNKLKISKLGEALFNHERKMWYFAIITKWIRA